MASIKRFEYTVTTTCANPVITWSEKAGVFISCSGKVLYASFADDYTDAKCVKLFIECPGCDNCEPIEKDVCFCDGTVPCGDCKDCIGGVCVERCPDKFCVNDTCVGCDPDHPCKGDKSCIGNECKCPTQKPFDLGNDRCGECVGKGDCEAKYGKCWTCIDNQCVHIDSCGDGVCDPRTGGCVDCNDGGDCKGENECCSDGKQCVCCTGFERDPLTGKCKEIPECTGNSCGPCGNCVGGKCVPRQCPDGKVCDPGTGDCLEKCDCNDPSSCTNKGNICKNINGVCACVTCGTCGGGCADGCHCLGNNGFSNSSNPCVVDNCHGTCDNPTDCKNGCGCLGHKCTDCAQLGCTQNCSDALGCECIGNDCAQTGTRCVGSCHTRGDCGKDCTCHNEQCVPCEFFSCDTGDCSAHEGCRCNGTKCEGDPDYKCNDLLSIELVTSTCDIEGHLKKDRSCACPVITSLVQNASAPVVTPNSNTKYAGTVKLSLKAKLFKGNNTDDNFLLSNTANPEIAVNESASDGSINVRVISYFEPIGGSVPTPLETFVSGSIVGSEASPKGVVTFNDITIREIGKPFSAEEPSKIVNRVVVVAQMRGWAFPNTCEYANVDSAPVTVNTTGGFKNVNITTTVSNSDTRNPLFTWWKSSTGSFTDANKIRTVYVPQNSSGEFIDTLPTGEVNGIKLVESCNHYKLAADCSCQPSKSKYVVFCKPPDFNADIDPLSCGTKVNVSIGQTCHANKNKLYELLVNGEVQQIKGSTKQFSLWGSGASGVFTKAAGITSVVLRMVCNGAYECVITKPFNPPVPPNVSPDAECAGDTGDGTKVKYTFSKTKYDPPLLSVIVNTKAGVLVTPTTDTATEITYLLDPYIASPESGIYTFEAAFKCGKVTGTLKKNCCSYFAPKLVGKCTTTRRWGNLFATGVTYKIGIPSGSGPAYPITYGQLKTMDINVPYVLNGVTLQPNQNYAVSYETVGCGVQIVTTLPCSKILDFTPEKVGDTPIMKIPPESIDPAHVDGDTYQLKVNGGSWTSYVPDTNFTGIYGVNKVELRRDGISTEKTLEIRTAATCDITEANLVVSQSGSKYVVSVPEVACECTSIVPVPFIINSIVKNGSNFRVSFSDLFSGVQVLNEIAEQGNGAKPLIESGVVTISAKSFSQSINVSNTNQINGYVDIPCATQISDPINLSYSLERLYEGSAPYPDNSSVLKMCLNWPSSLGTTITGITLSNITHTQSIVGTSTSSVCWRFEGVDLSFGAFVKFVISLSDSTSFEVSAIDIQYPVGDDFPFVYGDDEAVCDNCLGYVGISFTGTLVNGCVYPFSTPNYAGNHGELDAYSRFCDGDTQVIVSGYMARYFLFEGGGGGGFTTKPGKAKVNFYEDGTLIKRQYIDGGTDTATLDGTQPSNPNGIDYGKTYTADANCYCSESTTFGCLKPTISGTTVCTTGYYSDGSSVLKLRYSIASAYPNQSISIYKNDGTLIETTTTNSSGAIVNRDVTLSEAQAELDNDILVYAQFDSTCKSDIKLISRSKSTLSWTKDCTNSPLTYDLIFTGSPTLEIVSGTGAVSGSSIIDIPNNTTIVFKGTVSGCTSKEYTELVDCTVSPSPTPTPTPTRSINVSVTKTPTVTRSRSVSPFGGDAITILSGTPSRTPSRTPSITVSNSVSATIGASPSITPTATRSVSVSKSISVSQTVSASVNASPSITPTVTSSISVTKTPSPTPSISAACDSDCSHYPTYDGQLCGGLAGVCCHGQSYDPFYYTCCSGVLIGAGDVNNCGGCGIVCPPGATCENGSCVVNTGAFATAIYDTHCLATGGYCVHSASIATKIPNTATDISVVSFLLNYDRGTQAGGAITIDVTNSVTHSETPDGVSNTKVSLFANFDAIRVNYGLNGFSSSGATSEDNICVIAYKIGSVNYKAHFHGGGSLYVEYQNSPGGTCASDCPWIG